MISVLALLLLAGVGAVLWSKAHAFPGSQAARGDRPLRLLQWAVELLHGDRVDWGHAMLGELDRIEGRWARWRFALGCVGGVLVQPLGGISVGAMVGLSAAALGGAAVLIIGFVHFNLAENPWNWVWIVIIGALLMSFVIAVSVFLRRPEVSGPGLVGGLFVAAAWFACSRLTFFGLTDPIRSLGRLSVPILLMVVPVVVGIGGAWRSGDPLVGRRIAWLSAVSAGLTMFFVSAIAVVAIDGGPRDPGTGVAGGVSEAFFLVAMLYLIFLPLATATIGWIAVTGTGRLRAANLARRDLGAGDSPGTPARRDTGWRRRTIGFRLIRGAVVLVVFAGAVLLFFAR